MRSWTEVHVVRGSLHSRGACRPGGVPLSIRMATASVPRPLRMANVVSSLTVDRHASTTLRATAANSGSLCHCSQNGKMSAACTTGSTGSDAPYIVSEGSAGACTCTCACADAGSGGACAATGAGSAGRGSAAAAAVGSGRSEANGGRAEEEETLAAESAGAVVTGGAGGDDVTASASDDDGSEGGVTARNGADE